MPNNVDYFLKFDDSAKIKGESKDKTHKDEIQVLSWSLGVHNTGTFEASGGGGAGKAQVSDVTIMKNYDLASVNIFVACATGLHIPSVVLSARRAGGDQSTLR